MKFDIHGEFTSEFSFVDFEADSLEDAKEKAKKVIESGGQHHLLSPTIVVDYIHIETADSEK